MNGSVKGRVHPYLGVDRYDSDVCSLCSTAIPEDWVPLIVWTATGDKMWCYCERCEGEAASVLGELGKWIDGAYVPPVGTA